MNNSFAHITFSGLRGTQKTGRQTNRKGETQFRWESLLGCLAIWLAGAAGASAITTNVVFQNFSFTPQTVTIQVGDTIVWTNAGGLHTVTGDGTDPFCGPNPVATTCSETFTNVGTFPYHCNFHQAFGMVGTVIVRGNVKLENTFVQRNLVSDQPGQADQVDTNLVNAWGLATSATSPFWVSDNHTGLSTLYNSTGGVQALVVTIPAPSGAAGPAAPTGIVFNSTTNFTAGGKATRFIFATEDGTIAAWGSGTNAILTVDNSGSGAVYKGLALASNLLFAANFHAATVEVFDGNFAPLVRAGAFVDPNMATNYAPFDLEAFGNKLYVTYAQQDSAKHDDVAGSGHGFIDVYDLSGNLLNRLISGGPLNSPWGMAMAPSTFGAYPGALLVGNFGDGSINAFDPVTGTFLGPLSDATGTPIKIDGLWALRFGNGGQGGDPNVLYFTAGPGGETHGLFGSIAPANYLRIMSVSRNPAGLALTLVGGTPPYLIQQKLSLADSTWSNVTTTTNLSVVLPETNSAAFFRVMDHATVP